MNKSEWLRCWGFVSGTPEAEAAWAEKLSFQPRRAGFIIGSSPDYNYTCPITDRPITSKHAHEENLKIHGCRVLESGEKEVSSTVRQREEAELDRQIEATVEREIDLMPGDKREKLCNELESGLSVEVTRL